MLLRLQPLRLIASCTLLPCCGRIGFITTESEQHLYAPEGGCKCKTEFTGSDRSRLNKTIEQELKIPAVAQLVLDARKNGR